MLCLSKAEAELQLRGLMVWTKLVQGNMANLSASDRCTACSMLSTHVAYPGPPASMLHVPDQSLNYLHDILPAAPAHVLCHLQRYCRLAPHYTAGAMLLKRHTCSAQTCCNLCTCLDGRGLLQACCRCMKCTYLHCMFCRAGVNGILIKWFAATGTSSECQVNIAELLQVTGAYSISGVLTIAAASLPQLLNIS